MTLASVLSRLGYPLTVLIIRSGSRKALCATAALPPFLFGFEFGLRWLGIDGLIGKAEESAGLIPDGRFFRNCFRLEMGEYDSTGSV